MMDSYSQQNTCFDCGKSFENNRAFFNHKRVHQKVDCSHCNSSIPVNSKKYHEAKCSGKFEKKFTCENCPFKSEFEQSLKRHQKICTNMKFVKYLFNACATFVRYSLCNIYPTFGEDVCNISAIFVP